MTAQNLSEKAMLVKLEIKEWSGNPVDREVTDKIIHDAGASSDAGKYRKRLMPAALKPIAAARQRVRETFNEFTLPWDNGVRILPAKAYFEFTQVMSVGIELFENEVKKFLNDYQANVQLDRQRLNGLFKESDYPNQDKMSRKFGIVSTVLPMPDSDDFRVSLTKEETKKIKDEMEKQIMQKVEQSQLDLYHRLIEVVGNLADRLDDDEAKFRTSSIENIRTLLDILPKLNILDDKRLMEIAAKVRDIASQQPEVLRTDKPTRKKTAKAAKDVVKECQQVIDQMEGIF